MPDPVTRSLTLEVGTRIGRVPALWTTAGDPARVAALAHGAGAGMEHPFLAAFAESLAGRGVGVLRYQFPYMAAKTRRPDPPPVAHAAVRSAVAEAARLAPGVPILAGGKSFGGRMTSQAAAAEPLPGVAGLYFLGFPLHPPKRPSTTRAEHLSAVSVPMLFLQGTRDDLADLDLLRPICEAFGPRATLHVVEGADHSFHVLKRSGRTDAEVLEELVEAVAGM